MERSSWIPPDVAGMTNPAANLTWTEADRSWMKAKQRSIRTILDSVDLMRHREKSRRRRKLAAALFVAAGGLGLAALMAFASGGPGDTPALASDDFAEETQEADGAGAPSLAAAGNASAGESAPGVNALASGNAGPNGTDASGGATVPRSSVSASGSINNPTNPFDALPSPIAAGDSGDGAGTPGLPPISASLGLSALKEGAGLSADAMIQGVLGAHAEGSSSILGDTPPGAGLLPSDASEPDASVNDDSLLGRLLAGLLD